MTSALATFLLALAAINLAAAAATPAPTAITSTLSGKDRPSRCGAACTTHGVCHEELGRCDCPRHLGGADCSEALGGPRLAARCRELWYGSVEACTEQQQPCMNSCNARGACVAGFCHCSPGFFGSDCSLSLDARGTPQLLAGSGYAPRATSPRVYVYELPPRFTAWYNLGITDRHVGLQLQQRLLSAGVRTADGDAADWYYIPVFVRNTAARGDVQKAVRYVRDRFPYYNRTQGHRHFLLALGDMGRYEALKLKSINPNITWVTYWGLHQDKPKARWQASHRPQQDIVLPVYITHTRFQQLGLMQAPLHPKWAQAQQQAGLLAQQQRANATFFFAGRVCGDYSTPGANGTCLTENNSAYSAGVRQKVYYHHWQRPGFLLLLRDPDYGLHMLTSRFCFGPNGGGHGQRQVQAALAGCVPVVISDGEHQPWEPLMDWNEFGVRVAEADIPRLHEVLGAIGPREYARKQAALRCAAQHLAYSSLTGGFMGESGAYDAFETLMQVLRAKAAHPGLPVERLRQADAQLDAFLRCEGHITAASANFLAPAAAAGGALQVGGSDAGATKAAAAPAAAGGPQQRGQQLVSGPGAKAALCSWSEFDRNDTSVDSCAWFQHKKRYKRFWNRVYAWPGGMLCARQPSDLAACPRLWA